MPGRQKTPAKSRSKKSTPAPSRRSRRTRNLSPETSGTPNDPRTTKTGSVVDERPPPPRRSSRLNTTVAVDQGKEESPIQPSQMDVLNSPSRQTDQLDATLENHTQGRASTEIGSVENEDGIQAANIVDSQTTMASVAKRPSKNKPSKPSPLEKASESKQVGGTLTPMANITTVLGDEEASLSSSTALVSKGDDSLPTILPTANDKKGHSLSKDECFTEEDSSTTFDPSVVLEEAPTLEDEKDMDDAADSVQSKSESTHVSSNCTKALIAKTLLDQGLGDPSFTMEFMGIVKQMDWTVLPEEHLKNALVDMKQNIPSFMNKHQQQEFQDFVAKIDGKIEYAKMKGKKKMIGEHFATCLKNESSQKSVFLIAYFYWDFRHHATSVHFATADRLAKYLGTVGEDDDPSECLESALLHHDQIVRLALQLEQYQMGEEVDAHFENRLRENRALLEESLRDSSAFFNQSTSKKVDMDFLRQAIFEAILFQDFIRTTSTHVDFENLFASSNKHQESLIQIVKEAHSSLPTEHAKYSLLLEAKALSFRKGENDFNDVVQNVSNNDLLKLCGLASLLTLGASFDISTTLNRKQSVDPAAVVQEDSIQSLSSKTDQGPNLHEQQGESSSFQADTSVLVEEDLSLETAALHSDVDKGQAGITSDDSLFAQQETLRMDNRRFASKQDDDDFGDDDDISPSKEGTSKGTLIPGDDELLIGTHEPILTQRDCLDEMKSLIYNLIDLCMTSDREGNPFRFLNRATKSRFNECKKSFVRGSAPAWFKSPLEIEAAKQDPPSEVVENLEVLRSMLADDDAYTKMMEKIDAGCIGSAKVIQEINYIINRKKVSEEATQAAFKIAKTMASSFRSILSEFVFDFAKNASSGSEEIKRIFIMYLFDGIIHSGALSNKDKSDAFLKSDLAMSKEEVSAVRKGSSADEYRNAFRAHVAKHLMKSSTFPAIDGYISIACKIVHMKESKKTPSAVLIPMVRRLLPILGTSTSSDYVVKDSAAGRYTVITGKEPPSADDSIRILPPDFDVMGLVHHIQEVPEMASAYLKAPYRVTDNGKQAKRIEPFMMEFDRLLKQDTESHEDRNLSVDRALAGQIWDLEQDIEVVDIVASGAFGIVLVVRFKKIPEHHYAMKLESFDQGTFVPYFCRSLVVSAKVREHPNVVPVLSYLSFLLRDDNDDDGDDDDLNFLGINEDSADFAVKENIVMCMVMPLCSETLEEKVRKTHEEYEAKKEALSEDCKAMKDRAGTNNKKKKQAINTYFAGKLEELKLDLLISYVSWARPILQALRTMHAEDVVHRDLKPANILFDQKDDLQIGDFGLARQISKKEGAQKNESLTARCGTERYMAPEVSDSGNYGAPADIYSCGIILYEFMKGRTPSESKASKGKKNRTDDFGNKQSYHMKSFRDEYLTLCDNMFSSDPKARYTAEGCISILDKMAKDYAGHRPSYKSYEDCKYPRA